MSQKELESYLQLSDMPLVRINLEDCSMSRHYVEFVRNVIKRTGRTLYELDLSKDRYQVMKDIDTCFLEEGSVVLMDLLSIKDPTIEKFEEYISCVHCKRDRVVANSNGQIIIAPAEFNGTPIKQIAILYSDLESCINIFKV